MSTSDPNAVQKTGDTMTGQLVIKGDQFDPSTGGNAAGILITNSAGSDSAGIWMGSFGDSVNFRKANGAQLALRMDGYPGGGIIIADSVGGSFIITPGLETTMAIYWTSGGINTQLYPDAATGDLLVKCTAGPNAGKKVNLTAGKWA